MRDERRRHVTYAVGVDMRSAYALAMLMMICFDDERCYATRARAVDTQSRYAA